MHAQGKPFPIGASARPACAKALRTLGHHQDLIVDLAFSPDGQLVASASADHTARVWSVKEGRLRLLLAGHVGALTALAFSPDGRLLATSGWDGTVRLWDVETGQSILVINAKMGPCFNLAFSPDGDSVAVTGFQNVGPGHMVRLYRFTGRHEQTLLTGPRKRGIVFHPQKPWAALLPRTAAECFQMLDVHANRPAPGWPATLEPFIRAAAFSADGTKLITAQEQKQAGRVVTRSIELWDVATGQRLRVYAVAGDTTAKIGFDPSAKKVGACGKGLMVMDIETGTVERTWNFKPKQIFLRAPIIVHDFAFLNQGAQVVAALANGSVQVRDIANGNIVTQATTGTSAANAWISPDGSCLAQMHGAGHLLIRDLPDLKPRVQRDGVLTSLTAGAISPDGRWLATGGLHDKKLVLWNTRTLEQVLILPQEGGGVSLTFSPDGAYLAVCGKERHAVVHELRRVRAQLAAIGLDWE